MSTRAAPSSDHPDRLTITLPFDPPVATDGDYHFDLLRFAVSLFHAPVAILAEWAADRGEVLGNASLAPSASPDELAAWSADLFAPALARAPMIAPPMATLENGILTIMLDTPADASPRALMCDASRTVTLLADEGRVVRRCRADVRPGPDEPRRTPTHADHVHALQAQLRALREVEAHFRRREADRLFEARLAAFWPRVAG